MDKKSQSLSAGILFAIIVVIHISTGFIHFSEDMPTAESLILSQALILLPIIIYFTIPMAYYATTKKKMVDILRFRKVNIWSVFLVIPVVYCFYPLLICVNAFSMAFSTNVIANTMTDITSQYPYIVSLLLMAFMPAVVEELTFRGVLMGSFHRDSNPWPAIIFSAVCFGAMHMNFNQMAYAFVLGICMGLVIEASGSILSSMLVHFLYNGTSVTLMYLMSRFTGSMPDTSSVSSGQMLMTAGIMLPFALVGVALAGLLLYVIARLNKRDLIFLGMFKKKTKEQKLAMAADKVTIMTPPVWVGLILCVGYAVFTEILVRSMG